MEKSDFDFKVYLEIEDDRGLVIDVYKVFLLKCVEFDRIWMFNKWCKLIYIYSYMIFIYK